MKEYNFMASNYDQIHENEKSIKERLQIAQMLSPHLHPNTNIMDIGCGTGSLLDMFPSIKPKNYIGIDPSIRMLNRLIEKHPDFTESIICAKYEQTLLKKQDIRISLFGSVSFLDPNKALFMSPSYYFFMFYKEGYIPREFKLNSIEPKHNDYSLSRLKQFLDNVIVFNNYYIATNLF